MADTSHAHSLTPSLKTRRIVTGHDADGQSTILMDSACPVSVAIWHPDFVLNEIWRADTFPADNGAFIDPCTTVELEGAPTGNVVRIVQFPPDADYVHQADAAAGFGDMGETGPDALSVSDDAPHPLMHKTNSLDYIVVIKGEIYAVLDKTETLLRQGDVLVQRGTNHAWSNRSGEPCIIVAVLNGAVPVSAQMGA